MVRTEKFTLYTSKASQWAMVPHLGLLEKGYNESEYETKEIDLIAAANFDPDYLRINPNGTVPLLTAPSLDKPLVDSADILSFLDQGRPSAGLSLAPADPRTQKIVQQLIELVHSDDVGTNLILLMARSQKEFEAIQGSPWKTFVGNRQRVLEENHAEFPEDPFYTEKRQQNGELNALFTSKVGPDHEPFFAHTTEGYRAFAAGLDKLESLLVLPYAAGGELTLADLHIVPWLAHAMWGAGGTGVEDFDPLERSVQVTVAEFKIGPKIRQWWSVIRQRDSFKSVYPVLH